MKIRPGGLMRCCLASLYDDQPEEKEGNLYQCNHCSSGRMIYRSGAWEWDHTFNSSSTSE